MIFFFDNGTEKSEEGVVPFKIFVWQIGRVFLELNQHTNTKKYTTLQPLSPH